MTTEHSYTGGFNDAATLAFAELTGGLQGQQEHEEFDADDLKTTKQDHPAVKELAEAHRKQKTVGGKDAAVAFTEFAVRLEELRSKRRNDRPMTSDEWKELDEKETTTRRLREKQTTFAEVFGPEPEECNAAPARAKGATLKQRALEAQKKRRAKG